MLDVEDRHHRGREAADGADREVDLAEQQHVDDADRDQADGGDLEHQVGQVLGGEEAVVLELEDRPDQGQADDDPQRGEVALDQAAQVAAGLAGAPRIRSRLSSLIRRPRPRSPFSFSSSSSPRPVIAETTCSSVVCSALKSPAGAAEAEDEDPVGDLEDVDQVVADHDHAEPALAQAPDQVQHLRRLGDAERRRRLVEQHDLGLAEQRAGDRDLLALAAGERADLAAQAGDRHRQVGEQLARPVLHPRLVELARDRAGPGRDLLAPEEEVGDDVEVVAEGEVLVDGRDPQVGRVLRFGDRDLLAVEADRAGVGAVDAGDRLHHRRLAGAVVADEADDLARVDGEVDPVQAWTGPNRLLTPSSSRSGAPVGHLSR